MIVAQQQKKHEVQDLYFLKCSGLWGLQSLWDRHIGHPKKASTYRKKKHIHSLSRSSFGKSHLSENSGRESQSNELSE